jgi:hypothetical protein
MKITLSLLTLIVSGFFLNGCDKEPATPPSKPVADAGVSKTVQLPTNTVSVTGVGTTTNGSITGYLWSLVSGPNVPVIASPSSATTNINGLIAGTYVMQFSVTDNLGLTGVDTMSIVVNPAIQYTITLQPGNNPNDAHVDSYNGTGGVAADFEVEIASWTISGTTTHWRSFIKFDQSVIPAGSTIVSATLYLYTKPTTPHGIDPVNAHSGTNNAFYVERITGNWSAAPLPWVGQPATTTVNRVLVPQSASASENAVINVTALVQDMVNSGNYGFAFKLQNEVIYNARQYASSYFATATLRPKLVIVYQ